MFTSFFVLVQSSVYLLMYSENIGFSDPRNMSHLEDIGWSGNADTEGPAGCAAAFSHSRPTFMSLDPSNFENPVPVGSVLYLTATVAYTDPPLVNNSENGQSPFSKGVEFQDSSLGSEFTRIQIRIDSKVRNIEHGETKPTGQFNYTFLIARDIKVMPRTYSEFMIWIDARRRAERVNASIKGLEEADVNAHASDDGKTARVTE